MTSTQPQPEPTGKSLTQWVQLVLPILILVVLGGWLLAQAARAGQPKGQSTYDYTAFGRIAVSEDGRVKPLDTVARNALLMLSGKQSLQKEMLLPREGDADRPATQWLAEALAGLPEARERNVFRIDDPGVLGLMGKTTADGKLFSLNDILPALQEIERLALEAQNVRDDERSQFQEHVIGLRQKVAVMYQLQTMSGPFVLPPTKEGEDWQPIAEPDGHPTPAAAQRASGETWIKLIGAYAERDPGAFNAAVKAHRALIDELQPRPAHKAVFEHGFNDYRPFAKGIVFYTLAGVLSLLALLLRPLLPTGWYKALWQTGTGILLLTFVLHTAALIVRIWLQGRPPVTNLYSSAVFIGWAVVGGAIILELITRLGVASFASSTVGVATLFIAHNLAKEGDTMGVMQAVLDSNFWLGTHVISITLGYAATFLAGFIAILYIVFGMATPVLDRKTARVMAGMVYAVICFALLFSFVGTVLGGIWADQSWGRFWGWDPKENGAILIVLMNAIILHARWGHMIKERGLMVLAVGGNIVTAWSWFGTNMLGVGLHAYGFMDKAYYYLAGFVASQLVIMAAALLVPTAYWLSFARTKPVQAERGPKPGKPPKTGKPAPAAST